mgnify:FL=1
MIRTDNNNVIDRTNLAVKPTGADDKKAYSIKCYTKEDWVFIHEELEKDGSLEDNIPDPSIVCPDKKEHSDTRATYMMTDAEAEDLRKHEKVEFVCIDYDVYPGNYHPDPKDITTGVQKIARFGKSVSNYRAWNTAPSRPPTSQAGIGASDKNRTGYTILRHTQKENPWDCTSNGVTGNDHLIFEQDIFQLGDGTGVDAIVSDDGFWVAHPEFCTTSDDPVGWSTGNALTWSGISTTPGTCGVLDLVLDAPYYIDPDFFNNNPSLLTQRWDGTTVPIDSAARSWWSDASQRSVGFSTIGTTSGISTFYTRARCNGSQTAKPTNGTNHGTQCAGQVFGKNYGSAYNANRWVINGIGSYDAGINGSQFDVQKLFHLYKPNYDRHSVTSGKQNSNKNPTLSSNSWGYRASTIHNGGYYWYRPADIDGSVSGVSYDSGSEPAFFDLLGAYGDGGRCKGEMVDSSVTSAGKEMSDAGVIFVCAAGNSNQTQQSPGDLDYNNYWATSDNTALSSATHTEFGLNCYNTINRRGWPQSLGKTTAGLSTAGTEFPAINIGALNDNYFAGGYVNNTDYKETKVSYSDMGTGIDCYGAADQTLTCDGEAVDQTYVHPETYSGLVPTPYDINFSGTSSGCPTCAGWLVTKLQYNREWTWRELKDWLKNQCGTQDPDRFYYGQDITSFTATTQSWEDVASVQSYGQGPVVIWDAPTGSPSEPKKPEITITNSPNLKISGGVEIKFS